MCVQIRLILKKCLRNDVLVLFTHCNMMSSIFKHGYSIISRDFTSVMSASVHAVLY